jgi:uncharacterized OsmC-like protein
MLPLPHRYSVTSVAEPNVHVRLNSAGLAELTSEPPREFGGPGCFWSPETLLLAAVADCFTLTFRAAAQAHHLPWTRMQCTAQGIVDRKDGPTRFTKIHLSVLLTIPVATDNDRARTILEKTERNCLVANSLKSQRTLETAVEVEADEELKTA